MPLLDGCRVRLTNPRVPGGSRQAVPTTEGQHCLTSGGGSLEAAAAPQAVAHSVLAPHLFADRLGHLLGADGVRVVAMRLEIVGDVLAFGDHRGHGVFESLRGIRLS